MTLEMKWPANQQAERLLRTLLAKKFKRGTLIGIAEELNLEVSSRALSASDVADSLVDSASSKQRLRLVEYLMGTVSGGPRPLALAALESDLKHLGAMCAKARAKVQRRPTKETDVAHPEPPVGASATTGMTFATQTTSSPKRAFISYTHDSEPHKARVLALSNRLCNEGVDCSLDRYEVSPPEGWPAWMERMIHEADFVLVVCTPTYLERYMNRGERTKGKGGRWEGALIRLDLYEASVINTKFIPVVFDIEDAENRPLPLRAATYYDVSTEVGYEALYRHLTVQPLLRKPTVGRIRTLATATSTSATSALKASSDAKSFQELCGRIRPLMEENRRVFADFGPNSGAASVGPVRLDLGMWERAKRELILPNNQRIASLIKGGRELIPATHRAVFDAWLSHIYAFEKHCEDPTVEYRQHQFPTGVAPVVLAGAARNPEDDAELKGLVAQLERGLAAYKGITAAGLFGSQLYVAEIRKDVDLVLRLSRKVQGSELVSRLKGEFLQHHGHHLHCTVFFDDQLDEYDEFIRKAGAVHSLNLSRRR